MLTIALQADNEKKLLLENFCIAYKHILKKHNLIATQATAQHIRIATGLNITELLAGGLGGNKQLESSIMNNEVDVLLSFEKFDLDSLHDAPSSRDALVRLCDLYNVPVATNIPTAECLVMCLDRHELDWREEMRH